MPIGALWLGYAAFVVYGSLVPLDFNPLALERAWREFRGMPFLNLGAGSRADWIANGVLYLPLGVLAAKSLRRAGPWGAWLLATMLCWAMALAVEFAQVFFPPRTVSQNDILAEWIGSAAGAALAVPLRSWFDRLGEAVRRGGGAHGQHVLEAYAAGYVLLSFFPYDLVVSWAELRAKAGSDLWSWALVRSARGSLYSLLQLGVEVLLSAPIGVWLSRRGRPAGVAAALVVGAALGLVIELGQFLIVSGVSHGASVLSRSVGVAAGAALAPRFAGAGLAGVRVWLHRWSIPLGAGYALLLLAVNGSFSGRWLGTAAAAATWAKLRLLPFYYHYYTTEAQALISLLSVALMYLPLAAIGWARKWSTAATIAAIACAALAVESSKLFIAGLKPDPTNLIIAAAAGALLLALLAWLERPRDAAAALATSAPLPRPVDLRWLLLGAPATALLWAAAAPALAGWIALLLVLAAAAVWRWPALAVAIVPAALPVLDLAPWTGRVFWDEFDLLLATCLAAAAYRCKAKAQASSDAGLTLVFALLGTSLALSALRPLLQAVPLDAGAFSSFVGPLNGLRITKGALWAWCFAVVFRRLAGDGAPVAAMFRAGMLVGLAATCAVIAWERLHFAGLFDFDADFRVTGAISAMHRGGAYLECWLAVASAFAIATALHAATPARRIAAAALVAAAAYAMMVTYSRNGYLALMVVLLAWAALAVAARSGRAQRLAAAAAIIALVAVIAAPILAGRFAQDRLAQTAEEIGVRMAHWSDALRIRDPGLLTSAIGMGIGTFPDAHYWRSGESVRAGSYRLRTEGGDTFVRLGPGATLYLEQIVPRATGPLAVTARLRSADGDASISIALCEKWLLTSRRCAKLKLEAPPGAAAGRWHTASGPLDPSALTGSAAWPALPWKLALATPDKGGAIDVDDLAVRAPSGEPLLANGGFEAGADRWFFATDKDPPWHIHSLPVAVLFDQGWFGVIAWALVLTVVVSRSVALNMRTQAIEPSALAALAAFVVSATVNTLIDTPRFLWLVLVLMWLAAQPLAAHGQARRRAA